jgi:hypothetical protein
VTKHLQRRKANPNGAPFKGAPKGLSRRRPDFGFAEGGLPLGRVSGTALPHRSTPAGKKFKIRANKLMETAIIEWN